MSRNDFQATASKWLPASLGTLFGQPFEKIDSRMPLPDPPANLPGAHAAPELCTIVDQYRADLLPKNAVAEVKLDGIRCLYIAGRLWTREGSPFEAAEHCLPILKEIEVALGVPMFFDGEYVEDGGLEATLSAFRSRKGQGVLWLFDAVPFAEWQSGRPSQRTLRERKDVLLQCIIRLTWPHADCPVGMIDDRPVSSPADVEARAQALWREGYEGIVVKDAASRYLRKRTCDWMKVKLRTVSNVVVVDIVGCQRKVSVCDQFGRHDEMRDCAKALLVRLPGEDMTKTAPAERFHRQMRVAVPSGGLSETIWRERGNIIGRQCRVEHAGFTGAGNLREPILKEVGF